MQENILQYRMIDFGGALQGNQILIDYASYENRMDMIPNIWQVFVVPLSDYNRLMEKEETLSAGEAIICTTKEMEYTQSTIQIGDSEPLKVKKRVESFVDNGVDSMQIFPSMYLFVPDLETAAESLKDYTLGDENQSLASFHWYYGFDLPCEDENQILIQNQIQEQMDRIKARSEKDSLFLFHVRLEGAAKERADFYGLYSGLLFLGILLGIVFIFAAVLIIYYKQISEGYEDQSRFEIMEKVGMTKQEIKKSVNSQILTVFFLPLLTAGVHLGFAFPLIQKLLLLFGLTNIRLLIITTVCCYLIFAVFYLIVYRMTSHSYFSIVSGIHNGNE